MTDNVDKPNHYTFGKYECIDVIEELSKQNNLQGIEGFCMGISLNICGDTNARMEWKIYRKPDGI